MKKVAQYIDNFLSEPVLNGWKKYLDHLIIKPGASIDELDPEIPLILPANPLKYTKEWMRRKNPFFAINRPYLGNWRFNGNQMGLRISVNSFACIKVGKFVGPRWHTLGINKKHVWKVKEVKNVLLAPSTRGQTVFTGMSDVEWSEQLKAKLESEGAVVKIRYRSGKPDKRYSSLWTDFDWADMVVSVVSGVTAESFWYGKKTISLGLCPTWTCCETNLDNWKNPVEPVGRDIWHEHIAHVQFAMSDWCTGLAQEITHQYQGWPTEIPDNNMEIKLP